MMKELSNKVCIVGVDESDEIGTLPGKSMLSLHLEATHNAIRDAGLKVSDIEACSPPASTRRPPSPRRWA